MGGSVSRSKSSGGNSELTPEHFLECLCVSDQVIPRASNIVNLERSTFPCPTSHRHSISCIACFGPCNDIVVTGSEDRTIKIWDFSDDQRLSQHWADLRMKRVDCEHVSTPAFPGRPPEHLYSALCCPLSSRSGEGHQRWVTCVAMDWARSLVYSGGMDKDVKAWDARSGACLLTLAGHADWVTHLAIAAPGALYSASSDGEVGARHRPQTNQGKRLDQKALFPR